MILRDLLVPLVVYHGCYQTCWVIPRSGGGGRPDCRRIFVPVASLRLPGHTGYQQKGRLAPYSAIFYTTDYSSLLKTSLGCSVPVNFMRDDGSGQEGLDRQTASRLFRQQFPAPVPHCGGGGRTMGGDPQRAAPAPTFFPQPPSWPRAEELPLPARSAPRRHLAPAARAGAAAAQPWRCSRLSPAPPSPGSPPPAAPRALREVKSWENRASLHSSPAASGTRRRPRSGRRGAGAGLGWARARNHRPRRLRGAARGLLVSSWFCYFLFSSSFFLPPLLALDILKSVFCLLSQIIVVKDVFWKVTREILIHCITLAIVVAV